MSKTIKRKATYYVYILQCRNGTYYTGSTKDLEKRIELHNKGRGAKFLRGKGPVRLVYAKTYSYYKNVLRAERNIKHLSRRRKDELVAIYRQCFIQSQGPSQFC